MPAKPRKSNPNKPTTIVLRLPGKYKNEIVEHAESLGVPYTSWCVEVLVRALWEGQGLVEAPPASVGVPSRLEVLRGYLSGEGLVLPCGRVGLVCAGSSGGVRLGSGFFCPECRVRVG